MGKSSNSIGPWWWVPTLYFAEGVPYFVVNNISVMMFAKMGVPNGQMAFFTTLLYFPWFLKGLWSPLVDVIKTKRWWIITMQIIMTIMMILLCFHIIFQKTGSLRFCHTRHCCRRILYAGS